MIGSQYSFANELIRSVDMIQRLLGFGRLGGACRTYALLGRGGFTTLTAGLAGVHATGR
jgi:hypothetical protein